MASTRARSGLGGWRGRGWRANRGRHPQPTPSFFSWDSLSVVVRGSLFVLAVPPIPPLRFQDPAAVRLHAAAAGVDDRLARPKNGCKKERGRVAANATGPRPPRHACTSLPHLQPPAPAAARGAPRARARPGRRGRAGMPPRAGTRARTHPRRPPGGEGAAVAPARSAAPARRRALRRRAPRGRARRPRRSPPGGGARRHAGGRARGVVGVRAQSAARRLDGEVSSRAPALSLL